MSQSLRDKLLIADTWPEKADAIDEHYRQNTPQLSTDASGNTVMVGGDGAEYAALPTADPSTGEILTYSRALNPLTCLYRLQEAGGSLLVDAFGNGPDLTLAGTLGTARTANAGYLTPNGTTHYARVTDLNSVLAQVMDFRNTDDSAIMFGFDLVNAADFLASSVLLSIGGGALGTDGRFRVQFSAAETLQLSCRGVNDTDTTFDTISGIGTTGVSTRVSVMLVFHSPVGYTYQVDAYNDGVFVSTASVNFNKSGLATSLTHAAPNGVTLLARESTTPAEFFNSSGSTVGVRHLFLRRSKHDAAQEARIASNLFFFPGERPATLSK